MSDNKKWPRWDDPKILTDEIFSLHYQQDPYTPECTCKNPIQKSLNHHQNPWRDYFRVISDQAILDCIGKGCYRCGKSFNNSGEWILSKSNYHLPLLFCPSCFQKDRKYSVEEKCPLARNDWELLYV